MPLEINEETGLKAESLPALFKAGWSNSRIKAVYIAVETDKILMMPVEEASAWVYSEYGGELKNAKVVPGSTSSTGSARGLRFSLKEGKSASLKDKKYYLNITPKSPANASLLSRYTSSDSFNELSLDEKLVCYALEAFSPRMFSYND